MLWVRAAIGIRLQIVNMRTVFSAGLL